MSAKKRKISDYLCTRLLECIRFSPTSESDSYTSGIHQTRIGLGGVGYSYWKSHATLALHEVLPDIREASSKDLSLSEAQELIDGFCRLHINPLIAGQFHWQIGRGSLGGHLSDEQRESLNRDFFFYLFEFTREKWHWAPLNSIIGVDYRGHSLILAEVPEAPGVSHEEMSQFLRKPLFDNATKYAGLKARNAEHAKEKLGILLGAIFLCMHTGTHHSHTMGRPTSGLLFFEGGMTIYSTRAHLPYLANKVELTEADFPLLSRVEELLEGDGVDRKLVRSLRWLSASWFASGAERFSLICQAIDALTPSGLNTMRAKCDWIREQLGGEVALEPIELLFKKIRSDIAHGDAPSLIESQTYLEFLSRYGVDPELAAVEIVRKILVDRFLPCVSVRLNPILAFPGYIEDQKKIFARYGMDFNLSTGFPFAKLSG